jgi:nucleotide-binding universal stress UspA family protein
MVIESKLKEFKMHKKILVPLDGSEVAEGIVSEVEDLASGTGAEVIVLQVLPETGVLPTTAHQEFNKAKQYLDGIVQRLASQGIKASTAIRYGKPAEEIVDYAQTSDADLIAMCTHGRSGVSRWVFGSVAEKVLRGTSLSILLCRAPGITAYGLPPAPEIEL